MQKQDLFGEPSRTSYLGVLLGEPAELVQMRNQFLAEKGERQSMSLVSSCLAFATPLMPFGFLSTFFLLGKLDGLDRGPDALFARRCGGLKAEMARLAAADALARKRKLEGGDETDVVSLLLSTRNRRPDFLVSGQSSLWSSEKKVIPKLKGKERLERKLFVTCESAKKLQDLRKQRLTLEALKESENRPRSFSEVSEIAGRLEILDKLISKMTSR